MMALFSRSSTARGKRAATASERRRSGAKPSARRASASAPAVSDETNTRADESKDPAQSDRPRPVHLEGGPYDAADVPEEERIDLGGLAIPAIPGMELRMEMDRRTKSVTGANLMLDGSALQMQAFAAPKSRGLWKEVRASLRDSVVQQGGTAEVRQGPFGPELTTRLPLSRPDGRTGYRPARFIGVDGPRWLLRAILTGPALGDAQQAARFEEIISRTVVVRGQEAMAPQELIPLHLPGERQRSLPARENPLDPLDRGPEITEIG